MPECITCGAPAYDEKQRGLCDTCWVALCDGTSIEAARAEVEELARDVTARLASEPCTCGAGCGAVFINEKVKGSRPAKRMGVIHFDVHHADDCPRSPGRFDWDEVDEDARERVFGYRGQAHHMGRLITGLSELRDDRLVFDA